jgi:SAM-dependent methyltransferase
MHMLDFRQPNERLNSSTKLMEVTSCPACGSTAGSPIGTQEIAGFPFATTAGVFVQEDYSIRECIECGLLYKTRTLSADDFSAYYEQVDFRKWESAVPYPTEREVLSLLKSLPANSKCLDFGCSTGRLLALLPGSYDRYGYEVNQTAAAEAKEKGIRILSSEELGATSQDFFDAIVMMDVFEHLSDPVPVLSRLVALIRPGGMLIIGTGDGDYAVCRRDPAQFWYFRMIEHVIMMTKKHGDWLSNRLAMNLRHWKNVTHYDSTWRGRIVQNLQHFAYWQFQDGAPIVKGVLRLLPGMRKAAHWPVAPGFSSGKDHVIAVFIKPHATV